MSRPTLANHPAVSFTVKRPPGLFRGARGSESNPSFPVPASITRPAAGPISGNAPPVRIRQNGRRNHSDDDSSGEDGGTEDEIITGFDSLGVQRCAGLLHFVKSDA